MEIFNVLAFIVVIGIFYWYCKKLIESYNKVVDSQTKFFNEVRHGVADLRDGGKYLGEQLKPHLTEENLHKAGKQLVEAAATGIAVGIITGIAQSMSEQNKKGRP